MTDAHESIGEDVKQESPDKLHGRQCHRLELIPIFSIPVEESNLAVLDREDGMVGKRDSMSIASQVVENFVGRGEWFFSVDDPFLLAEGLEQSSESVRIGQRSGLAWELELPLREGLIE